MDTICDNESLSYSVTVQNCPVINSVSWLINSAVVNSNNSLVFDTTGFQQGDVLLAEFAQLGYAHVEVRQDFAGLDRIVIGQWATNAE